MTFWRLIKVLLGIEPKPIEDAPSYLSGPGAGGKYSGTRQLSTRMDLKLSIVRTNLTILHKDGLIRDTGKNPGQGRSAENIWEVAE